MNKRFKDTTVTAAGACETTRVLNIQPDSPYNGTVTGRYRNKLFWEVQQVYHVSGFFRGYGYTANSDMIRVHMVMLAAMMSPEYTQSGMLACNTVLASILPSADSPPIINILKITNYSNDLGSYAGMPR